MLRNSPRFSAWAYRSRGAHVLRQVVEQGGIRIAAAVERLCCALQHRRSDKAAMQAHWLPFLHHLPTTAIDGQRIDILEVAPGALVDRLNQPAQPIKIGGCNPRQVIVRRRLFARWRVGLYAAHMVFRSHSGYRQQAKQYSSDVLHVGQVCNNNKTNVLFPIPQILGRKNPLPPIAASQIARKRLSLHYLSIR